MVGGGCFTVISLYVAEGSLASLNRLATALASAGLSSEQTSIEPACDGLPAAEAEDGAAPAVAAPAGDAGPPAADLAVLPLEPPQATTDSASAPPTADPRTSRPPCLNIMRALEQVGGAVSAQNPCRRTIAINRNQQETAGLRKTGCPGPPHYFKRVATTLITSPSRTAPNR